MGAGGTNSDITDPKEQEKVDEFYREIADNYQIRDCGIRLGLKDKNPKPSK